MNNRIRILRKTQMRLQETEELTTPEKSKPHT